MVWPAESSADLVGRSYDTAAGGYDEAWTTHMRDLSLAMLDRLQMPPGAACLDLTCGTGFVAGELARRTSGAVIGVDRSAGMIEVARGRHGAACCFVCSDALAFLQGTKARSFDVITCAWGLGYSRPWRIVREIARVLRPGGRVGVIDNSLFSLAEVLWASILAFAERPEALHHVMRVQFLPAPAVLAGIMRLNGLAVRDSWGGARTYRVADGRAAIERLRATGAAAGFEHAADPRFRDEVFARFAEVLERRYRGEDGVPITHRYLAAVGKKR